jgi:hypothetical protein
MTDIEPILDILYNYYAGFVLSQPEMDMLRDWREESDSHDNLFHEINNVLQWKSAVTSGELREHIRSRLLNMEEMGD